MIIAVLAIIGLSLGSFINALVWRLHEQSKKSLVTSRQSAGKKKPETRDQRLRTDSLSITRGRSMCPRCGHQLNTGDLLPIISWLALRGKCRYCAKPISWQYPLVELSTATLFVVSYLFWPTTLQGLPLQWLDFAVWLIVLTGLIALAVYDFRYMLLPNKIIFPLIVLVAFSTVAQAFLISDFGFLFSSVRGALIGGGLFYLLFQISRGAWIGGGDVKLGFLLGLILGSAESAFIMLFIASLFGTLFSLPLLVSGRLTPKAHIPFGPFLIAGAIIGQLFSPDLLNSYYNLALML